MGEYKIQVARPRHGNRNTSHQGKAHGCVSAHTLGACVWRQGGGANIYRMGMGAPFELVVRPAPMMLRRQKGHSGGAPLAGFSSLTTCGCVYKWRLQITYCVYKGCLCSWAHGLRLRLIKPFGQLDMSSHTCESK